jgi:hypothetical protein
VEWNTLRSSACLLAAAPRLHPSQQGTAVSPAPMSPYSAGIQHPEDAFHNTHIKGRAVEMVEVRGAAAAHGGLMLVEGGSVLHYAGYVCRTSAGDQGTLNTHLNQK